VARILWRSLLRASQSQGGKKKGKKKKDGNHCRPHWDDQLTARCLEFGGLKGRGGKGGRKGGRNPRNSTQQDEPPNSREGEREKGRKFKLAVHRVDDSHISTSTCSATTCFAPAKGEGGEKEKRRKSVPIIQSDVSSLSYSCLMTPLRSFAACAIFEKKKEKKKKKKGRNPESRNLFGAFNPHRLPNRR